jgi:threonyl-tRNA synthetase
MPDAKPLRSHRQIGEQLDLFHLPEHASGQICWHPAGLLLYRALEEMVRERYRGGGYDEVRTPLLCARSLWEVSGHWAKFQDKMILASCQGQEGALKPMNCPGHCDIYALRPRSYRELPLRIAELGHVHRAEQSGEINGLLRARAFVIDDAHIFAAPEQVPAELEACIGMIREIYDIFGLSMSVELSLRPEVRIGDDALWDQAEEGLRQALRQAGVPFEECPGEGAFYGPKADIHIEDSLGRSWQMGSVQLDYALPQRFGLGYVGANGREVDEAGEAHRPVMIHRALFGSLERFIGILLEDDDGWLPAWCAPRQVAILPVSAEQEEAAHLAKRYLEDAGARALVLSDGPLGGRIRRASELRVPLICVLGSREMLSGRLSVRQHGASEAMVEMGRDEILSALSIKASGRS